MRHVFVRTGSARADDGFTLIEVMVASLILVIVMLATLSTVDGASQMTSKDTGRAEAMREAQVGLDRMVREVRHARTVVAAGTHVIELDVFQRGVLRRVRFDCSVVSPADATRRQCVRTVGTASQVLVDQVRVPAGNPAVFTFTPAASPRHITVRLPLAVDDGKSGGYDHTLVLNDGTRLRNAA